MVEWKKLGEIGEFIRGSGIQKSDFVEEGFGCIHYGQIHTKYGLSASTTFSKIDEALYRKCKKAVKGDVILATTSEDAEGLAKPVVWLGDEDVAVSGDAYIFHHTQNGKYLAHVFASHLFTLFKIKNATGTKVVRISGESMARFKLPVPSLSEQQRIVGILDTFTSSIENLKEQIAQRRKQYEYYRDELLDLEGKEGVEMKTLGEVCDYVDYRGKTPTKVDNGVFLVTAKNIRKGYIDYSNSKEYIALDDYEIVMRRGKPQIGDVLITTEAPCGNVAQIDDENVALAQRVIKYRPRTISLNSSYLKYILMGEIFQARLDKEATGGTVKGIKGSKLHKMAIPIPPLSEQSRIVSILDTFEASIRNLEAQLKEREKQYEYYRNQLLTFE